MIRISGWPHPEPSLDAGLTVKLIFSTSRFPSRASLRCWSMGVTARGRLVRIGNHGPGDAVLTTGIIAAFVVFVVPSLRRG